MTKRALNIWDMWRGPLAYRNKCKKRKNIKRDLSTWEMRPVYMTKRALYIWDMWRGPLAYRHKCQKRNKCQKRPWVREKWDLCVQQKEPCKLETCDEALLSTTTKVKRHLFTLQMWLMNMTKRALYIWDMWRGPRTYPHKCQKRPKVKRGLYT